MFHCFPPPGPQYGGRALHYSLFCCQFVFLPILSSVRISSNLYDMSKLPLQGFYYDAFYGDLGLNEDHFKRIKEEAAKAVSVLLFYLAELPLI